MHPKFDDLVRAASLVLALSGVIYLAVVGHSEAAAGALIGFVGLGGSFLFRGKVQSPS